MATTLTTNSNKSSGGPTTTNFLNTTSTSSSSNDKSSLLGDIEKLSYEIFRFSSFATNYFPENILVDCPTDQTSRWSAQTNSPPQFLTLKLKRPAIVQRILFGKFDKAHVCNIKKFRIYGGLEENCMALLLEGGLKNDNKPETFNLRHITEDGSENLPILYLKIVPLLSWGPTFNFSIWYVELHGQDDPMYTNASMRNYNMLRETEVVRLCLKHFRQQGYDAAFKALQEQTQVRLEHTLITDLHKCLVVDGDFVHAEKFIVDCVQEGLMDDYLNRQHYKYTWRAQQTADSKQPGKRGGHQLVMDNNRRLIYLYGGWDGYRDLSDLWVYDIKQNSWTMLFESTEKFNGPTPRSCHKMVFDPVSENIFILGRYLENAIRTTDYIKSDFYLYDTRARTWLQICDDTSQVNGPQLVYDHQMCIDADKRTIYVFGGKILTPRSVNASTTTSEPEYSGLFSYHIATNTWTQIFVDCHHPSASQPDVLSIKSRVTHCMVFHNKKRKLYIYGGQRGKEDIDEFITYDVDTQMIEVLNKHNHTTATAANASSGAKGDVSYAGDGTTAVEPSPGYTLRATIDCERDEFYVFTSLSKLKDRRESQHEDASNSFWVYSLLTNKWNLVYTCRNTNDASSNLNSSEKSGALEPCPRYAHQMIYDDMSKVHYLFGGNPGKVSEAELRLDDFWMLELEKPKREEILRHCRYLIRKLHYEEMARANPYKAMYYLRYDVAEVINHDDPAQLSSFHKLASLLFKSDDTLAERPTISTPPLGSGSFIETDAKTTETKDIEDSNQKAEAQEDSSSDSYDSITAIASTTASASSIADIQAAADPLATTYNKYRKSGGKRARHDYIYDLKSRRSYLFNKLVQLMPKNMVQPERNLSDFVVM